MPGHTAVRGQKLTDQECLILAGVAHGLTALEIGHRHNLAESTVRTYLQRINIKLGARNRTHAVTIAFVRRYLKLPAAPARRPL